MDYSGFTWMFKSPGAKITVEDVRQTLIDLGSQRVRGWDLVVKQYSNQAELAGPMNVKSMARVYTIRDSALPTSIAILMHKSKRTTFAYRKPIDSLLRTVDLKLIESVEVHGSTYILGDIHFSFGQITKNNSPTKEIYLRVEMKSLVSTTSFDADQYQSIVDDIFTIAGMTMRSSFYNDDAIVKARCFIDTEYRRESTMTAKQSKMLFDNDMIALMHCLTLFGSV